MRIKFYKIFLFLLITGYIHAQISQINTATVNIDINSAKLVDTRTFLGTNFPLSRNYSENTTRSKEFIDSTLNVGVKYIRWPGGTISDYYDWKKEEIIEPGRRWKVEGRIDLEEILLFQKETDIEITVTVNFGTMTAEDAANLVEFFNGTSNSFWGAKRDSLLLVNGYEPGPINVKYFEVGNEVYAKHMFENSWTAENPRKYFLGGSAERKGGIPVEFNNENCFLPLGDFFKIKEEHLKQDNFPLRFKPVKDVRIYFIEDSSSAFSCFCNLNCNFPEFKLVDSFENIPSDSLVYQIDSTKGLITFGDGVNGFKPPLGSFILMEYTVYDQDGFIDYAEKMRGVESSVPIKIGAVMLPRHPGFPDSVLVPAEFLPNAYELMDFLVLHHYAPTNSIESSSYDYRREEAFIRSELQDSLYNIFKTDYQNYIGDGKEIGIAVTEWNLLNKNDKDVHFNRSLESALSALNWIAESVRRSVETPIWFAEQFDLASWDSKFALIETESGNYKIAPLGYLLKMFSNYSSHNFIDVDINSELELSFAKQIPLVNGIAAISTTGDSLSVFLANNSETDTVTCEIVINSNIYNFTTSIYLTGESPSANNDELMNPLIVKQRIYDFSLTSISIPPYTIVSLLYTVDKPTGIQQPKSNFPNKFMLYQNYPNPFNPTTKIKFNLLKREKVLLKVYDSLGREIRTLVDEVLNAGEHEVEFSGKNLSSGIYLYRLQNNLSSISKKMLLIQ